MTYSANAKLVLALMLCSIVALVVVTTRPVAAQDTPKIEVSATELTVLEQGTGTFTVELATQPSATVTVSVASADTAEATVSTSSLAFTAGTWNTAQTVTVTGVDDDAFDSPKVMIALEATSTDTNYNGKTASVNVTVTNRETQIQRLNPVGTENNSTIVSGYFKVRVAFNPGGYGLTQSDLEVTGGTISGIVAGTRGSLNVWFVDIDVNEGASTVQVKVPEGAVNTGANETDADLPNAPAEITYSVIPALTAAFTTRAVEPVVGNFVVKLTFSEDVTESGSGDEVNTWKFSPSDDISVSHGRYAWHGRVSDRVWNIGITPNASIGTTTVSLPRGRVATGQDTDVWNLASSIKLQAGKRALSFGQATYSVGESDEVAITVGLNADPLRTVKVPLAVTTLGGASQADFAGVPASITFNAGDTEKTFRFTATQDLIDDDGESVSIGLPDTLPNIIKSGSTPAAKVTIIDDDTAALVMSPTDFTVAENGSAAFTVKLATEPTDTVTVAVRPDLPAAATASPPTLTFTVGDWHRAKTVTVFGVDDADASDESVSVSLRPTGGGYLGVDGTVYVTVDDDDTPNIVADPVSFEVSEAGSGNIAVKLATKPIGTVTVAVSSDKTDAATVSDPSLSFTVNDWNTAQTVTVRGVDDTDADGETVTVSLSASGADYAGTSASVSVTVADDDTANLMVDPGTLRFGEDGAGDFTVKLATQPSGDVTVGVSSDDTDAATVSPDTLTFTTINWGNARTVTVSGEQDADASPERVTVSLVASGGGYAGKRATVAATITDDDVPSMVVDPMTVTVDEGSSASLQVRLSTQPTTTVTVEVRSDDTDAATVSPASLTFTASNWNNNRTLTVTGQSDADAGDDTATVSLAARGGDYSGKTRDVPVIVSDDETASLSINPTTLTVQENGTAQFTVRLATLPTSTVTVTVRSNDSAAATVTPRTLTFTTSDWNSNRTVTVAGVDDTNADDETVEVSISASGGGYFGVAATVGISVNDDETPVSSDASLSNLSLRNGSSVVALTPAFSAAVRSYTASVPKDVHNIQVRATANHSDASVSYLNASGMTIAAPDTSPLSLGNNQIQIRVVSEDGVTYRTYSVAVTRATGLQDLVSNTGQGGNATVNVGASGTEQRSFAQQFTTGSHAGLYAIAEVKATLGAVGNSAEPKVSVFTDASGDPGAKLFELSNPATISANAVNTFQAPPGARLVRATQYWLVFENENDTSGASNRYSLSVSDSDSHDGTPAAGWSIADERETRTAEGGAWTAHTQVLRIAVRGFTTADATLSDLELEDSAGDAAVLNQPISLDDTHYTAFVDSGEAQVTVTPTTRDTQATLEYLDAGGNALSDSNAGADGHQVALASNNTTFKIRVIARDSNTAETYTIVVRRIAAVSLVSNHASSSSADHRSLTDQPFTTGPSALGYLLSSVGITVVMDHLNEDDHDINDILVRLASSGADGKADLDNAIALTNPASVNDGSQSQFTAPAGTILSPNTTYHVIVTNAAADSAPVGRLEHTDSTAENSGRARGWRIGNKRYIFQPAQDGWVERSSDLLMIQIRGKILTSNDATLSWLELEDPDGNSAILDPEFDPETNRYNVAVPKEVDQVTVLPTTSNHHATVRHLDGRNVAKPDDDPATDGHQVSLDVGRNTIGVMVTAGDLKTTETYTVILSRAASADADPQRPRVDGNRQRVGNCPGAGFCSRYCQLHRGRGNRGGHGNGHRHRH